MRSKYADVPLPAPSSMGGLGNIGFNPLCPCMRADRGMPPAAGANLLRKYADALMAALCYKMLG